MTETMGTEQAGPAPQRRTIADEADAQYKEWLARIRTRFTETVGADASPAPLFTTDADKLWDAYIEGITEEIRPLYVCHACRFFIERFAGLVTIDDKGRIKSAIWEEEDVPEFYRASVAAVLARVKASAVTGVFLSSDETWGKPVTGVWKHLSIEPLSSMVYNRKTLNASQAMAEKREDFKTVLAVLNDYSPETLGQAVRLLKSESLYQSEKVLGQALWLSQLHALWRAGRRGKGAVSNNIVWRAVATAPAGFCHPRSSMIGALLDDIAAGLEFGEVSRRFAAKMHPLLYLRPQAAPTAGAIAAAEKIMEQLGASGALARRFARLDDIQPLWMAQAEKPASTGGIFGHLKPKESGTNALDMTIPAITMTWEKFARTVLPVADSIEYYAPTTKADYVVLVTAVNADAPPILQWDTEAKRNPVSWYVWVNGSLPAQFGLSGGKFHKVSAVTYKPSMWGREEIAIDHQGQGVIFLLDGAQDTKVAGAALFPSFLKSEFHGIRAVIEAYSKGAKLEGIDGPQACGILLGKGRASLAPESTGWNALFRVTANGHALTYRLDRWD